MSCMHHIHVTSPHITTHLVGDGGRVCTDNIRIVTGIVSLMGPERADTNSVTKIMKKQPDGQSRRSAQQSDGQTGQHCRPTQCLINNAVNTIGQPITTRPTLSVNAISEQQLGHHCRSTRCLSNNSVNIVGQPGV